MHPHAQDQPWSFDLGVHLVAAAMNVVMSPASVPVLDAPVASA